MTDYPHIGRRFVWARLKKPQDRGLLSTEQWFLCVEQDGEYHILDPRWLADEVANDNVEVVEVTYPLISMNDICSSCGRARLFHVWPRRMCSPLNARLPSEGAERGRPAPSQLTDAMRNLLLYFQSGNDVPVERAVIRADAKEVVAARAALEEELRRADD